MSFILPVVTCLLIAASGYCCERRRHRRWGKVG